MFARKLNGFEDYSNHTGMKPLSQKGLEQRIKNMEEVVFPAISERTQALLNAQKQSFDKKHHIIDIPVDSQVMIKLQQHGKLDLIL